MKLTRNQKAQLLALYQATALSRGSSAAAADLTMGNTLVIGKLRDFGLAESKSVGRLGRHWTEYWLTAAGIEQARAVAQAQNSA